MKKILFSFIAIVMSAAVHSDTIPEGDIYGTWTLAGSPYLINGTTTVPAGSTLIIEPGVVVEWLGSYTMYVNGQILAEGTENDPVLFTASDPETGFRSIRFLDTTRTGRTDISRFTNCIFEYGRAFGDFPDNCGGAIKAINFSDIIIDSCLFRYNQATELHPFPDISSSGGAIALRASSPTIKNSRFENNTAYMGGAIACYQEANPLIENNTFVSNEAIGSGYAQGYGGAISVIDDCAPELRYNTFTENTADNGGGGVAAIVACSPDIHHNLFYGNTAGWGGAIEIQDTCQVNFVNNTIADNHADYGGGLHLWYGDRAEVRNTIFWDNKATSGGDQIYLEEGTDTLMISYSDIQGGIAGIGGNGMIMEGDGNIDEDPMFEGTSTCFYHLLVGSPCIDAGNPFCFDPDTTTCDMGAFWCNYLGVGVPQYRVAGSGLRMQAFPNPADWIVNLQFTIYNVQSISLKIYDLYGREMMTIMDGMQPKGEYTIPVSVSDLPAGVYLVRLQAGNEIAVIKLLKG